MLGNALAYNVSRAHYMVYTLSSVKIFGVQHDEYVGDFSWIANKNVYIPQITPASSEWSQFSFPQPSKTQSTKRDCELQTAENTNVIRWETSVLTKKYKHC